MKEYRQPKHSLKKQISILFPFEIYDGAKRDAQKYGRSMAYHIVETLRLTYDKSIKEVQAEREEAAKVQSEVFIAPQYPNFHWRIRSQRCY